MKTLVSAAAVTALAGSAFGLGESLDRTNTAIFNLDTPGVTITKRALDSAAPVGGGSTLIYDSVASGAGFIAAPASTGSLGAEDYGSILSPSGAPNGAPTTALDTVNLTAFQFVGGTAVPSGILFFDFFFNNFTTANSFGVQLPSAGNFIWTITLGNPAASGIPSEGYMSITTNTNPGIGPVTSGQWFLSDVGANPLVGHNDTAFDNGTFDYGTTTTPDVRNIGHNFNLTIPTPGAAALMGLAGIAGIRRRR